MNKEKYYKFDKRLYGTLNFNSPRCGKTYYEIIKSWKKLKERIEYLERSNDRREDTILEQRQEISNLKDNWNELKNFLKNTRKENLEWDKKHKCEWKGYNAYSELLIKMQEIEKGSDK